MKIATDTENGRMYLIFPGCPDSIKKVLETCESIEQPGDSDTKMYLDEDKEPILIRIDNYESKVIEFR